MIGTTEQEIMKNWRGNISKPTASVCTITYNHEKFIAETLDSFLMQETDFPFEIVISDDCSTDNNIDIIRTYSEKFPNIIKANPRTKNVGMTTNFTKNMKRAKGKYIALCEGDDYWTDPLKLQKQVDFLEENDDYVITYTSVEAFDENGEIEKYIGGATRDLESIELQECTRINTLTVCFRNMIKDFPPEYQCTKFGDIFLWSLLGAYGKGKYLNDIRSARYRIHDGGIFSKKTTEQKAKMIYLTNFALYSYYLRINDEKLSDYFHENSVHSALRLYGRYYYVKIILKTIVERIFNFIK